MDSVSTKYGIEEVIPFYDCTSQNIPIRVNHLFWQNTEDNVDPYRTNYFNKNWTYIYKRKVFDKDILAYLEKKKRSCICSCTDGCMNPKTCPCYKFNNKLKQFTYKKELRDQKLLIESLRLVDGHFNEQSEYIEANYEVDSTVEVTEQR